jgi:hypothetical protein
MIYWGRKVEQVKGLVGDVVVTSPAWTMPLWLQQLTAYGQAVAVGLTILILLARLYFICRTGKDPEGDDE